MSDIDPNAAPPPQDPLTPPEPSPPDPLAKLTEQVSALAGVVSTMAERRQDPISAGQPQYQQQLPADPMDSLTAPDRDRLQSLSITDPLAYQREVQALYQRHSQQVSPFRRSRS